MWHPSFRCIRMHFCSRDYFLFRGVSILTPATSLSVAVMCAMAGGVSHVSLGLFGTRSARA